MTGANKLETMIRGVLIAWASAHRWWSDDLDPFARPEPDTAWVIRENEVGRFVLRSRDGVRVWAVAPSTALAWALALEAGEKINVGTTDTWFLVLRVAGIASTYDVVSALEVAADHAQATGHPVGHVLALYLHRWLHGHEDGQFDAVAMLREYASSAAFRRHGGFVWAPRKTKIGDLVLVRGDPYEVAFDNWTDKANRRKHMRVRPTDRMPNKRTPVVERAPESGPWAETARLAYAGVGPQGDLLAAREQRERDRRGSP